MPGENHGLPSRQNQTRQVVLCRAQGRIQQPAAQWATDRKNQRGRNTSVITNHPLFIAFIIYTILGSESNGSFCHLSNFICFLLADSWLACHHFYSLIRIFSGYADLKGLPIQGVINLCQSATTSRAGGMRMAPGRGRATSDGGR